MISQNPYRPIRWIARVVVLYIATILPNLAAHAEPVLMEKTGDGIAKQQVNPDVVLRQRSVVFDFNLFETAAPKHVELNLFEDARYTASLLQAELSPDGGLIWIGAIHGYPGSRVTLVVKGRQVSATIWVDLQRFDLRSLSDEAAVVQQVDVETIVAKMPGGRDHDSMKTEPLLQRAALSPFEQEVLVLVNQERSKYAGLHLLSPEDRLANAARAHSQDMSANDYFSHTSPDGRTAGDRITAAGYHWGTYGENIARGYRTPEAVMNGWMSSSGHRNNILNQAFCDLGVGHVSDGDYWTQDFGRLQGVAQCPIGNRAPTAAFSAEPDSGSAPLEVTFNADISSDPEGDSLIFAWDLGDDRSASGVFVTHTYETAGLYTVVLSVSDNDGASDSVSRTIVVNSTENTAPSALDDSYRCDRDGFLQVEPDGILENDTDAENPQALAAVLVEAPAHGHFTFDERGGFTYRPAPGFTGSDGFVYSATDGIFQSEPATVTITVKEAPTLPDIEPQPSDSSSGGGGGGCFLQSIRNS